MVRSLKRKVWVVAFQCAVACESKGMRALSVPSARRRRGHWPAGRVGWCWGLACGIGEELPLAEERVEAKMGSADAGVGLLRW